MSVEQIINVKVLEPSSGGVAIGPPVFFACLEDGEDVPLFQYDETRINYDPVQFIGLSVKEALALKRIKDLIWYGTVID